MTGPQRWVRAGLLESQPAQTDEVLQVMMRSSVTRTGCDSPQGASVTSPVAGSMRFPSVTTTEEVRPLSSPAEVDHSSWGRPSVRLYPRSLLFWLLLLSQS